MSSAKPIPPRRKPAAKKPVAKTAATVSAAQALLNVVNRYDAAGNGRRMAGWQPRPSGPNKAIEGLQKLRDRHRDSVRNDWAASAGVQRWVTTLIGTGITPRFPKIEAEGEREAVVELVEDWMKTCDADGVNTFFAQESLATLTWFVGGECFGRFRYRRSGHGLPIGMQIQLMEPEMVPLLDADNWPGMPAGNRLRSGIEFNRVGQIVAYWFHKEHPQDGNISSIGSKDLVRVPKAEVLHLFEPKRPGQIRGVPDFAPVMAHLRTLMDFNDAVLERQKLANLLTAFIKKAGNGIDQGATDPITGQPLANGESPLIGLEPGAVIELAPGEDIALVNPPEAGTTFGDYMRTQHTYTAAGQNQPYEVLTGDIREVSDRTLRVVMNEYRRFAEQRQWQRIIPMWCDPAMQAALQQAVLEGAINPTTYDQARRVEWQPHGWAYIHPVQDVDAKLKEVEGGLRSRSSVIAERGDDPQKVDKERKADKEREDKLGIAPVPVAKPGAKKDDGDGDGVSPGEYPRNEARIFNEVIATLAEAMRRPDQPQTLDEVKALIARIEAREPAMPQITAHIHVPPTQVAVEAPKVDVTVENKVEPTPVTVENKVAPTPVTVENKIAAPVVNVTNEVSVDLPDRETTSIIERDSSGNITNVTQTERTVQ